MSYITDISAKIKEALKKIDLEVGSLTSQNINLLEVNKELSSENSKLKEQCHQAILEIEDCLKTIEIIEKNGNNNN